VGVGNAAACESVAVAVASAEASSTRRASSWQPTCSLDPAADVSCQAVSPKVSVKAAVYESPVSTSCFTEIRCSLRYRGCEALRT
jgi:hypothetical protein